jgi:hypothetical protein
MLCVGSPCQIAFGPDTLHHVHVFAQNMSPARYRQGIRTFVTRGYLNHNVHAQGKHCKRTHQVAVHRAKAATVLHFTLLHPRFKASTWNNRSVRPNDFRLLRRLGSRLLVQGLAGRLASIQRPTGPHRSLGIDVVLGNSAELCPRHSLLRHQHRMDSHISPQSPCSSNRSEGLHR